MSPLVALWSSICMSELLFWTPVWDSQVLDDDNDSTLFHSFKKVEERAKKQQKHQQRQWRRSMKTTDVSWERMQQSTRSPPRGHTLNDNTTAVCLQENTIIFYHKGAAHSPSGIGSIHAHKLLLLLVSISIFVFVQLRICVQKESLTTITAP